MTAQRSPTVRRRRLGVTLRRLREDAGLTIDRVAEALECSDSKISRIETGHVSASPRDVRDMLELYRVDDAQRDALIQIAREARQPGWWYAYDDVPGGVPAQVSLEVVAASIRTYMALLVPALLQTEEYARAVIRAVRPDLPAQKVERRVEFRMARQALFKREDPPAFWVILDEAVLRRPIGTHRIMRVQLHRLTEATALPSVTLQVLPVAAGGHAGLDGPFMLLSFPDPAEPDIVILDSAAGDLYLESAEEVSRYGEVFEHLRTAALTPNDSAAFIARLTEEL